jgi:hypothetical protein
VLSEGPFEFFEWLNRIMSVININRTEIGFDWIKSPVQRNTRAEIELPQG